MFIKTKDKLNIYYEIIKNKKKPFIVFIHGLNNNISVFKNQVDFFKKKYSILLIDLRGYGNSDKPNNKSYYKTEKFVDDIYNIIKKENIKNYYLIGFSLGGYIALYLDKKIKSKKIILINPVFGKKSLKLNFIIEILISKFIPNFILKYFIKSYKLYEYKGLLDLYAKCLINTNRNIPFFIYSYLKPIKELNIKKKVIIIKSKKDELLNQNIPLKNYELIKINSYHMSITQKSKEINELLKIHIN